MIKCHLNKRMSPIIEGAQRVQSLALCILFIMSFKASVTPLTLAVITLLCCESVLMQSCLKS